ncbi:MAG TPA: M20/M25/M40 family metallo-hydrolase [Caulobacteraceae bacterium]|nr:M20/M25/M40 family metallo-hydrolase [Caulobacteraceae bacterium]
MRVLGLFLAFALALPAHAADATTARALRDAALKDDTAWRLLEDLTTSIGPRPVGSPGMERAMEWGVAQFRALGFSNINVEEFAKPAWRRGAESAEIVAPYPMKLSVLALGRSPATPAAGIEAPVVVFRTYSEMLAQPVGAFAGRIVVVNEPMVRTQDAAGYSQINRVRTRGPVEAARRGAVAYLHRSLSTGDSNAPHTGATSWPAGEPQIPAAALGVPDADQLERLAAGGPVRVRLNLQSHTDQDAKAWNIGAEIPGREKPEEIVLIGAHLDSWDPSPGAHDDAAGIAITTAAAKLIAALPKKPRRTIRVVMFGSEETGGSEKAYAEMHARENIVIASESDLGGDRAYALRLPAGSRDHPVMQTAAEVLSPLRIYVDTAPATTGGADIAGLKAAGVPVFNIRQDASRYFDLHHSADDTLDKIDPDELAQNVAVWAAFLYTVANSDIDFRAKPATEGPK